MTATINELLTPASGVEVSFTWTPAGTYSYTAPNGVVLSGPDATVNMLLTFTATATIDRQGADLTGPLTIIEYHWDFGDGIIGYGSPVTHVYQIVNFQTQTALRVTDSQGRQWFTRAQMYLNDGASSGGPDDALATTPLGWYDSP